MPSNLGDIVEYFEAYVNALEDAVDKAITATPLLIRQEFATQARKNLKTSMEEYMAALDIKLLDTVVVVDLDKTSWLANAVENGADSWDMKTTHLNGPNVKYSKKGFKYIRVPLPVYKDKGPTAGTDKAQVLQEKIKSALKDPSFSAPRMSRTRDGSVMVVERLLTADPALKGMIRTSSFGSPDDLAAGKRPRNMQYTLFRTMSNNPTSLSQWIHPGIKPRKLFPKVQGWAESTLTDLLVDIIKTEMEDFLRGNR